MNLAPILLLVYNRHESTRQIVDYLKSVSEYTELEIYVASDGPKGPDDADQVKKVRKIVEELEGCKKLFKKYSKTNLGLSNSVIQGIDWAFEKHNKLIIIEDDLILSPFFLEYMNYYLSYYENHFRVGTIQAYQFPIQVSWKGSVFFDNQVNCWGWGTWKNRWIYFEPDGKVLLNKILRRKKSYLFDREGAFPFTQMLKEQIEGKLDSWAIRWHASLFINGFINLYPNYSLVINAGMDGKGTHKEKSWFKQQISYENFTLTTPPPAVNIKAYKEVIRVRKKMRFQLKLKNLRVKIMVNGVKPLINKLKT